MKRDNATGFWRRRLWSPLAGGFQWFPMTLATLGGGLIGRAPRAWQRIAPGSRLGNAGAVGAALLSLLPSALAFVAALLVPYLAYAGWLYPLRPDTFPHLAHPFTSVKELSNAWGGDYLAGAWFGHAAIGTGLQLLSLAALVPLLRFRDAIARRG